MSEHHGNRYGRSEDAHHKILNAADDLLAEVGFAAVTMEGLAKRAGVAKQTIYRWWPTKGDVLLSALDRDAADRLTPPDTGSLSGDVRSAARLLAEFLLINDEGKMLRALRAHAQLDTAFAEKFDEQFVVGQRAREIAPFHRALERGELPDDFDVELGRTTLYGPIYEVEVDRLSLQFADAVADQWLTGTTSRRNAISSATTSSKASPT